MIGSKRYMETERRLGWLSCQNHWGVPVFRRGGINSGHLLPMSPPPKKAPNFKHSQMPGCPSGNGQGWRLSVGEHRGMGWPELIPPQRNTGKSPWFWQDFHPKAAFGFHVPPRVGQ